MTKDTKVAAQQLWFSAVGAVELRQTLLEPAADEVLVQASCSAVSAGTELLVYRGQLPAALALDSTLAVLQGQSDYPLRYGYASVGRVLACGAAVAPSWLGQRVFAFQPHASHFVARPDCLIPIPDEVPDEAAVFLANLETAVNLLHDGAPLLGERVVVFGLGIVGLLLSALLVQFPLAALHGLDPDPRRRAVAASLSRMDVSIADPAMLCARLGPADGADLLFEVSGAPQALAQALELSGFGSRIVIGSWYGNKDCALPLGGTAHRNRISLITSQVSTMAPALTARWTKARRFASVWDQLQYLQPQRWIDVRAPLTEAPALYRRLAAGDGAPLQALFIY